MKTKRPRRAGLGTSLAVAAAAILAAPSPAAAGSPDRYADPDGMSSAACTEPDPCDITTAVDGATAGQNVRLLGGTYTIGPFPLTLDDGQNVFADDRGDPVVIEEELGGEFPGGAIFVRGDTSGTAQARLSDVTVVTDHVFGGVGVSDAAVVERVVSISTADGPACPVFGGRVLRDSLCLSTGTGPALGTVDVNGFATLRARNVTAVSEQAPALDARASRFEEADDGGLLIFDVRNSILLGGADTSGVPDVRVVSTDPTTDVSVEIDNSNFDQVVAQDGGSPDFSVSAAGSASNQTAAPLFIDAAGEDFRQAVNSPTIDGGSVLLPDGNDLDTDPDPDPNIGTLDLDGEQRIQGDAIDIGAYESGLPPDTTAPELRITRGPAKTTRKRAATFRFSAADDSTPGLPDLSCKLDSKQAGACSSPKTYRNLKPGRHTFRVTATDQAGNSTTKRYAWKVVKKKRRRG